MFLPKKYFWRPDGLFRSLGDFNAGPLIEIGPLAGLEGQRLFVAEVVGGKVVGNTLLATTEDDNVFGGIQGLTGCADAESHWLLRRRRLRFPKRIGGTALLIAMNADNYFHWCFESMPRLKLLQLAGWDINRADWLVLSEHAPGFQAQMLGKMGVPVPKFLRCSKWNVLQFDKLIVPSMPMSPGGNIPAWVRDFLRETFLPAQSVSASAKLYISRRNIRRRRLANEAALEARLREEHQFRICMPEKMTFAEQVALFASAKVVVAPHGAGLTNLIFSQPGGHLIELFHPEHPNSCYERVAAAAGFGYHAVIGKSTLPQPCPDDRKAEFAIDINAVMMAVRAAEKSVSVSVE